MLGHARGTLDEEFCALYDRTYDRTWAFVLRRVFGEHDARDVVSETYMSVWRRMRDVPAEPILADAWVFGTARRIVANHRRSRLRRDRLAARLETVREVPPTVGCSEDTDLVRRALSGLPSRYAEVLQLSLWDELTTAQIAHVLSCSENAVAIRLHRARAALRDRYSALAAGGGAP